MNAKTISNNKWKRPGRGQYDFFAYHTALESMVYCDSWDDEEGSRYICYPCDPQGKYDPFDAYFLMKRDDLRVIPFLPFETVEFDG